MNLGKESETLEFKKTTGELKEAMVSISSILNKHGVGTLYFGVKPNGDVDGQDVTESSLRDVSRFVYPRAHRNTCPAGGWTPSNKVYESWRGLFLFCCGKILSEDSG